MRFQHIVLSSSLDFSGFLWRASLLLCILIFHTSFFCNLYEVSKQFLYPCLFYGTIAALLWYSVLDAGKSAWLVRDISLQHCRRCRKDRSLNHTALQIILPWMPSLNSIINSTKQNASLIFITAWSELLYVKAQTVTVKFNSQSLISRYYWYFQSLLALVPHFLWTGNMNEAWIGCKSLLSISVTVTLI